MAADPVAPRDGGLAIEIVWVGPDGAPASQPLRLPEGARVGDALAALEQVRPDGAQLAALRRGELSTAVYGTRCDEAALLNDGDRLELLGPLRADPKQARRRRAARGGH